MTLSRLPAFFRVPLAAFALASMSVSAATQIHLSPTGDDANPGTPAQPVATPQRAQQLVRGLIAAGLTTSVDVIFANGTWQLDAPLELRPEDSGTADFPITWKAAEGATPILSGGKPVTATWTDAGDGTWHVDLEGIGLGPDEWNFRQLFVDGSRATRARFPNASLANPFLYATGGSFAHAVIDPALIKPAWGTAADAQINIVPRSRFFNQWNTVTAVNPSTGRIDIADRERHRTIDAGSWFWIEGVREELDEPGEWFLDAENGRLHYMPEPGVDPNTLEFVAPTLNRIVNVKGDVDAGTHVAHVHFDGLHFRHTTFSLGHIEARVHTDTAIMFENTLDSSVRNCHFENIGGYALWLHLDSQRNHFDRNNVRHSGGGGVLLTGSRLGYMDDTKVYTPGEAAARVAPILNEITRNRVEHCGKIRYYGGGVHLDSRPFSMTMFPGNRIAHNHFNDLSRNGVFAFRNQGGNVVEYNHIHNAMQTTIDGGCIHIATMNTINAPNFILNNWLYDIWGNERLPDGTINRRLGNGVFLDWDTSNTTVKDNWIYNSVGGAVKVIWNNRNVVNTGNQSSNTPITPPFVDHVGPEGTATNGIDLANNRLTGSIIHYTQSEHFATTGTWTPESATGMWGLFSFNFLSGTAATPSKAIYTLPIPEDGTYEISLLYRPGNDRASNAPITIAHADGTTGLTWNMRQGSNHGFAVQVGTWRFEQGGTNTVTLSTTGTDGKVIADAVGFVKIDRNDPPEADNVRIEGTNAVGETLTASYTYSDADDDPEGPTLVRWYRSDDAVLDVGDTQIAGAFAVTPGAWKQSNSFSNNRNATFLSNSVGMNPEGNILYNLDGSLPGEPTSADGVSWMTSSKGELGAATAAGRVWIVADLGASHTLNAIRLWNWQWNLNGTTDLSNRGVSRFDILTRDSEADTDDGTPGGTPINLDNPADDATNALDNAAIFNPGSSNPWQEIVSNQTLDRAPNTDQHTGDRIDLSGQSARFVALRVGSHHAGSGIGLGKVRIDVGESTLTYELTPADVGKHIIVEVVPVAASGRATGLPETFTYGPIGDSFSLVAESFGGPAIALAGKAADVFSPLITDAGGSPTWVAAAGFLQSGAASGGNAAAYLNLGNFINRAKGTPEGKFQLTATLAETTGTWLSLGFAAENTPNIAKNFTNTGSGTGATTGLGSILYRAQSGVASPNANGDLDMFGITNQNRIDGPAVTGPRTLTVTLDLTPAGGYNGSDHFGTVTWSDSVLGTLASFTYPTNRNFGSILITGANAFTGSISNLALVRIPLESPPLTFGSWIGGFGLDPAKQGFDLDPDGDGIPNGIEAWFGTHPGEFNSGITLIATEGLITTFTHPQNPDPPVDITGFYEWSPNLVDWHPGGSGPDGGPTVNFLAETTDATTTVTATASAELERLFLRVLVSGS